LAQQTGAPHTVGEKAKEIALIWRDLYNLPAGFDPEADYDRLFAHGDTFKIGNIDVRVMLSPGHTLGSISYIAGDAGFVHDTLMQPDSGTSRADFPGGSSADLWASIQAILALPEDTRLFIGHDYGTSSRETPAAEATVAEHLRGNIHVKNGTERGAFTKLRDARDATLPLPAQMLYALQVNLRGGQIPPPEADGQSYFKIPVNRF
jgi:glyoxylase-like metal-dependent hydrolase (beta-lactamase superfamily II)